MQTFLPFEGSKDGSVMAVFGFTVPLLVVNNSDWIDILKRHIRSFEKDFAIHGDNVDFGVTESHLAV